MTAVPTIAFITICKGRLHHLRESLPLMAAQAPDELIVVDYSCPDGAGDWVEAAVPQARVVRVSGQAGFNASRARNAGAAAATSDWLFFVDADILMAPNMLESLRAGVAPGRFYRPFPKRTRVSSQIYGSFCCRREDFEQLGGYDPVIEGWGYEDQDMYERLNALGLRQSYYPVELAEVIAHEDDERHILPDMHDRWENEVINGCYSAAKRAISDLRGGNGNLSLDERRAIMANTRRIVSQWYRAGAAKPLPVRFVVGQTQPHRCASHITVHSETAVTVIVDPSQRRPETVTR